MQHLRPSLFQSNLPTAHLQQQRMPRTQQMWQPGRPLQTRVAEVQVTSPEHTQPFTHVLRAARYLL